MAIPVYILAGGKSRRFGSDKARALIHGQPLLSCLAAAVQSVSTRITVVAATAGAYDDLGLRTIGDLRPGGGPMAGLEAALSDCDQPWLAMLSCDLLAVQPAWIECLLDNRTDDAAAVAFRHRYWEPLIALYHQRILPTVKNRLTHAHLRMQALLDDVETVAVDPPPDWPELTQANTPADLHRITRNNDEPDPIG